MRIISPKIVKDFAREHSDSGPALSAWMKVVTGSTWANLAELRATYPHADQVIVASGKPVIVFNISGNKYRLISAVHFNTGLVFVLRIMTHAEYSKGNWKKRL